MRGPCRSRGAIINAGSGSGGTTVSSTIGGNISNIQNNALNSLVLSGPFSNTGTNVTFSGPGPISTSGVSSVTGNITANGPGTLALNGANVFTGGVTVNGGGLSTSNLAVSGTAQGLGKSTSAASNLTINGVLLGTSAGTTDHLFTVAANGKVSIYSTQFAPGYFGGNPGTSGIGFTGTGPIAFGGGCGHDAHARWVQRGEAIRTLRPVMSIPSRQRSMTSADR